MCKEHFNNPSGLVLMFVWPVLCWCIYYALNSLLCVSLVVRYICMWTVMILVIYI